MNFSKMIGPMMLVASMLSTVEAEGMVINPTEDEVRAAIDLGKKWADMKRESEEEFRQTFRDHHGRYSFGTGGSCHSGDVQTRLRIIAFLGYKQAIKYLEPNQEEIDTYLEADEFLITVNNCYGSPENLGNDHVVVKINNRILQPNNIMQTTENASGGIYINKTHAMFPYAAFEPEQNIIIILIPKVGEEAHFAIDLSRMP